MVSQVIRYNHLIALDSTPYKYTIVGYESLANSNDYILYCPHNIEIQGDWNIGNLGENQSDWLAPFHLAIGLYIEKLSPTNPDSFAGQLFAAGLREGDTIVEIAGLDLATRLKTQNHVLITRAWMQILLAQPSIEVHFARLGKIERCSVQRPQIVDLENCLSEQLAFDPVLSPREGSLGLLITELRDAVLAGGRIHLNPFRAAGMRPGDTVVAIDEFQAEDCRISDFQNKIELEVPLQVRYEREGEVIATTMHPKRVQDANGQNFLFGLTRRWVDRRSQTAGINIAGVFLMADLTVQGSLYNQWASPFIIVKGNLRAKNILFSAANVEVVGNVSVDHVIYFYDDASTFFVQGVVSGKFCILEAGGFAVAAPKDKQFEGYVIPSASHSLKPLCKTYEQFFSPKLSDEFERLEDSKAINTMTDAQLYQHLRQTFALETEEMLEFSAKRLVKAILSEEVLTRDDLSSF